MTEATIPGMPTRRLDRWARLATPKALLWLLGMVFAVLAAREALRLPSLLWDEVVYASQIAPGVTPVPWSEPRAWGTALLLAPVDLLTSAPLAIRLYLSAIAGLGLVLAFRPWLRVVSPWIAPVAAGLFLTLWTTVLYGALAYPNLWLALAIVAGSGYFWRSVDAEARDRWALLGVLVTVSMASLLRPTDATFLAAPLLVAGLVLRRWRAVVATAAGLAVGWVVWTGEAFVRFGGPIARLAASARINDVRLGFHPWPVLQSVDGPLLLCRPARLCVDVHLPEVLWWLALPVLVVLGIAVATRRWPFVIAAASGACLTASYVLSTDWANARFLIPAYALASLPVASLVIGAIRRRRAFALVIAALLLAHIATQFRTYQRVIRAPIRSTTATAREATALHDTLGLREPCVVFGPDAIRLSFMTHCAADWGKVPAVDDPTVLAVIASGRQATFITRSTTGVGSIPPGWRVAAIPGGKGTIGWVSEPVVQP